MEVVSAQAAADYLVSYVKRYRFDHQRFTAPAPDGSGYPTLDQSFVRPGSLTCYLAKNGYVLADNGHEPAYQWHIAGGPALMVDYEPTRNPPEVTEALKSDGWSGEPLGIYRIVSQESLGAETWTGALPVPLETERRSIQDLGITVKRYDLNLENLLERLTFGALGPILDFHLDDTSSDFWNPHQIRNLGFLTADRKNRRWFSLLEVSPHVSNSAWDKRAINTRIAVDIRRHFAQAFNKLEPQDAGGGFIDMGTETPLDPAHDRLQRLVDAADGLERLLEENELGHEYLFHDYIAQHPILLDVYARNAESKPRFVYPEGAGPLGKKYVEPDFVLSYNDGQYRLVEFERPSKSLATKSGQPRAELTQASWQIAEWKDYINHHYDLLEDKFPGISSKPSGLLVIGRSSESRPNNISLDRYKAMLREQGLDEVLTYDDLVLRARVATAQIETTLST